MKKIYAFILAALIIFTVVPNFSASAYNSDWASDDISEAYNLGILSDLILNSDMTQSITRLDFGIILFEILSKKVPDFDTSYTNTFTDTDDTRIYILANHGIMCAKYADIFAPNDTLTRQEIAVILNNASKFIGVKENITLIDTLFSDYSSIADWAKDSVIRMDSLSIMKSLNNNNFEPTHIYTKEEAIETLMRLYRLDINDYTAGVEEFKVSDKISIFCSLENQYVKNDGKLIFSTDDYWGYKNAKALEFNFSEDFKYLYVYFANKYYYDPTRTSVFRFESYYNIYNSDYKCPIINIETGEIVLEHFQSSFLVDHLVYTDETLNFADNYFVKFGKKGGSRICEICTYDGSLIAIYSYRFSNDDLCNYFQEKYPTVPTLQVHAFHPDFVDKYQYDTLSVAEHDE